MTARKPAAPAPADRVLLLRTCNADGTSYNGFRWPESGSVKCPDWNPEPVCGGGLHGLLWGEGRGDLLNWDADAIWQVVAADAADVVAIDGGGKVKVPRGEVVFSGGRLGATEYIIANGARGMAVVGSMVAAGYGGTATAGDRGTATAGDRGTATAGDRGTATAGDWGTATAGDRGTATAGDGGIIAVRWYDFAARRYPIVSADVGENGILPNVAYRVEALGGVGRLVRADGAE